MQPVMQSGFSTAVVGKGEIIMRTVCTVSIYTYICPSPRAQAYTYIRQITSAHVITNIFHYII